MGTITAPSLAGAAAADAACRTARPENSATGKPSAWRLPSISMKLRKRPPSNVDTARGLNLPILHQSRCLKLERAAELPSSHSHSPVSSNSLSQCPRNRQQARPRQEPYRSCVAAAPPLQWHARFPPGGRQPVAAGVPVPAERHPPRNADGPRATAPRPRELPQRSRVSHPKGDNSPHG